jgi:hypothetical protein
MLVLLTFAIVGLVLLAAAVLVALVLLSDHRQLDVIAQRLAAERRIEDVTRTTLQAMRDAVRR